jgi:hypothetical protein
MASMPHQRFNEQRSNQRFPVNAAIDYKIVLRNRMVLTGVGRTVNISSGGVLVDTPNCLPKGVDCLAGHPEWRRGSEGACHRSNGPSAR